MSERKTGSSRGCSFFPKTFNSNFFFLNLDLQGVINKLDQAVTSRIQALSTPKLNKPASHLPIENMPMCADYYVDWQLCYTKSILQLTSQDLLDADSNNQTVILQVNRFGIISDDTLDRFVIFQAL